MEAKIVDVILEYPVEKLRIWEGDPVPPLTQVEFVELKEDIRKRGIKEPLKVMEDGLIISGRHRYYAAMEIGLKIIPAHIAHEEDYPPPGPKLDAVLREEVILDACRRRHLTQEAKTKLISVLIAPSASPKSETPEPASNTKGKSDGTTKTGDGGAKTRNEEKASRVATGSHPPPPGERKKTPKEPGVKLETGEQTSQRKLAKAHGVSRGTVELAQRHKDAITEHPDLEQKPFKTAIRIAKERDRQFNLTPEEKEKEVWKAKIKSVFDMCCSCGQFPCKALKDLLDNIETGKCGRMGGTKKPAVSTIQKLIEAYKVAKGIPADDKTWDKKFFPAFLKPAKTIMATCDDDIDLAIKILNAGARYFNTKRFSWTLHTLAKPNTLPDLFSEVRNGPTGANGKRYRDADLDFSK